MAKIKLCDECRVEVEKLLAELDLYRRQRPIHLSTGKMMLEAIYYRLDGGKKLV